MRAAAIVASLLLVTACSDDGDGNRAIGEGPDDTPGETPSTFAAFVINLVQNQTVDDRAPVEFEAFATLPDPDAETNNTEAFSVLF